MKLPIPSNVNTRVALPAIAGLALLVAGLAWVGFATVNESVERNMDERLVLAQVTADRVDDLLVGTADMLAYMVEGADLDPEDPNLQSNRDFLRSMYDHLDGLAVYVGLVNSARVKIWTEPYTDWAVGLDLSNSPTIEQAFADGGPVFTNVFTVEGEQPSAAILLGIRGDAGAVVGLICVDLDLEHPRIANILTPTGLGGNSYAELVDRNGIVVASTRPNRLWQFVDRADHFGTLIDNQQTLVDTCHDCHGEEPAAVRGEPPREIVAFAPLSVAPWGVAVRQASGEALAFNRLIERRILTLGGVVLALSLAGTLFLGRSMLRPMQTLASACREIAGGDLDHPIPLTGSQELDECALCFEELRQRLKATVDEIEEWNEELEAKVQLRTNELERAERVHTELLRKVVVAQEEERKRLARELHDETSQSLTALMVGIETALRTPAETPDEVLGRLAAIKPRVQELLAELNRIIVDLRPSILDDLGLLQAIDWYAETRVKPLGLNVLVWTVGQERRLSSEVETMVFRIAQEAITNAVRHAEPRHISIGLSYRESHTMLIIEDDGVGFDLVEQTTNGNGRDHFGLMGMQERASLIGGDLRIQTKPGAGTHIFLEIPYNGARTDGSN
jgi:signal transduction histidine kinase